MITKYLSVFAILLVSLSIIAAIEIPANDNSNAPKTTPVVDNPYGFIRVDIIHYEKGYNRVDAASENCYGLLGFDWRNKIEPVNYVINPTNSNLINSFILSTFASSTGTWDSYSARQLFISPQIDTRARYGKLDGKNTIAFGKTSKGTIAVTRMWYNPSSMQMVEFDMLYNTLYKWGDGSINPTLMDLQNIATHELGHALGLDDMYSSTCNQVTMYGYSTNGETSKRTIENPDIAGLQLIYGA